jgi:hypothetical protein
MRTTIAVFAVLLLSLAIAVAQTGQVFHVTSVHKVTRDAEKTYHTAFNQLIIEGNIGNRHYTLGELDAFGA